MKRSIITVLIFLTAVTALDRGRSLPRMTEITLAEPVFVIGIDKSGEDTQVTLIYEKIENSDEGGGDSSQKYIRHATASTTAAAIETLKKNLPRETAISTADFFLIGESAAEEGMAKYTDFLLRNNTLRLTASVFVVRGEASEACDILVETRTLDILRNFGEYSGINALSSELKFFELLSEAKARDSYTVPALVIKEQDGERIAVPSGYAVIKDDKLSGFLDADTARGYNILRNKSTFSAIEIENGDLRIATRLENTKSRFVFNWEGDELRSITVNVNIRASVLDSGGGELNKTLIEHEQKQVIFAEGCKKQSACQEG
jgi:hypothetical protein